MRILKFRMRQQLTKGKRFFGDFQKNICELATKTISSLEPSIFILTELS